MGIWNDALAHAHLRNEQAYNFINSWEVERLVLIRDRLVRRRFTVVWMT